MTERVQILAEQKANEFHNSQLLLNEIILVVFFYLLPKTFVAKLGNQKEVLNF